MSLSEIIRSDPELQQVHEEVQSLQAEMMGTTDPTRLSELETAREELLNSERYRRFEAVQEDYNLRKGD